jgi:hypothetical protein
VRRNAMWQCYPEGHEREFQPIERSATCKCGRAFVQCILAEAELEAAERMGLIDRFAEQTDGFWLPRYCGPCERADIRRQAFIDEGRATAIAVTAHHRDRHDTNLPLSRD